MNNKALIAVMALAVTAIFLVVPKTGLSTWGINKTVGWAWDINMPYVLIALFLLIVIIASLVWFIKQSGSK